MPVTHATPKPLQVAAAVIGNALEWYDFIIFGVLTVVISRLFFPAESQFASLLLTTATFGVGFFMRPVGIIRAPSVETSSTLMLPSDTRAAA